MLKCRRIYLNIDGEQGSAGEQRRWQKKENTHVFVYALEIGRYALDKSRIAPHVPSHRLPTQLGFYQVQSNSNLLPIHSQMNNSKGMPFLRVGGNDGTASSITINIHIYVDNKITHSLLVHSASLSHSLPPARSIVYFCMSLVSKGPWNGIRAF